MRSALVLISGLAFLVIVAVVTFHLFDHFSEKKEEMIQRLPKPPSEATPGEFLVRIDATGTISQDHTPLSESQLAARLAKLAKSDGNRQVVIKPDENAPQIVISQVLDACAKAGISNVSLTSLSFDDAP